MVWALLLNLGLSGQEPFGLVITFRGTLGRRDPGNSLLEVGVQGLKVSLLCPNRSYQTIDREPMDLEEPDCLIKTKQRDNLITGPSSL